MAEHPDIGLVVKSQFRRNSPSALYPHCAELKAAMATGRYLELVNGSQRNIVFPAEAAMISDMVIGHLIGGTAPLEAGTARRAWLVRRWLASRLVRPPVPLRSLVWALAHVRARRTSLRVERQAFQRGQAQRQRLQG